MFFNFILIVVLSVNDKFKCEIVFIFIDFFSKHIVTELTAYKNKYSVQQKTFETNKSRIICF